VVVCFESVVAVGAVGAHFGGERKRFVWREILIDNGSLRENIKLTEGEGNIYKPVERGGLTARKNFLAKKGKNVCLSVPRDMQS